jgi:hypothetical protein
VQNPVAGRLNDFEISSGVKSIVRRFSHEQVVERKNLDGGYRSILRDNYEMAYD